MLDKNFIEERKKELLEQKARLEEELSSIANKEDGHYHPKFPNLGDFEEQNELEVEEYDETVDAEKKLSRILEDTDKALNAIEEGTYGFCKNCKKEIEEERLKAYSAATTCIECGK